jgi:hypothetical protein
MIYHLRNRGQWVGSSIEVITGRQVSCSSPATTDRHEHRPTQITAGRLRRSLAAPAHSSIRSARDYKRGTAGLSLLRRLSHGVALLSHCVTRVCCRISLYGIKRATSGGAGHGCVRPPPRLRAGPIPLAARGLTAVLARADPPGAGGQPRPALRVAAAMAFGHR